MTDFLCGNLVKRGQTLKYSLNWKLKMLILDFEKEIDTIRLIVYLSIVWV